MLKKLSVLLALVFATMGFAYAEVDVNKADQAALDGIKGVGPKKSKAILDARKSGGEFKNWADFEERVKGVGGKNAVKLAAAGLTVNGQSRSGSPASAAMPEKKGKMLSARRGASQPASAAASAKN
jgi:competence protein ComEA